MRAQECDNKEPSMTSCHMVHVLTCPSPPGSVRQSSVPPWPVRAHPSTPGSQPLDEQPSIGNKSKTMQPQS